VLPNTSGAATAEEAVRSARLARAGGLPDWVKLEVIPDSRYLLPDPVETLRAAEILVEDGFTVLPYVLPDPVLQKKLEEVGCATVMPLASPIGSGLGLLNPYGIRTIKQRLSVPVIVDAGVGTASDACITMEQGVDGILMNTAIAEARDPVGMARAMRWAVDAGRAAYLAGRMPRREVAVPSTTERGKLS
jgi:thiazole synthase